MADLETDTTLSNTGTGTISSNDYAKLKAENKQLQSENDRLTLECKEWKGKYKSMNSQIEKLEVMLQKSKESESYADMIKLVSELKLCADSSIQQKKDEDRNYPPGLVTQASVDSCNSSSFYPDTISSSTLSKNLHQQTDPKPADPNDVSLNWSPFHHPVSTQSAPSMHSPDAVPIHSNPTSQSEPPNRQPVANEARGELALAGNQTENPGMLRSMPGEIAASSVSSSISQVSSKEDQPVSKVNLVNDEMCDFIKKWVVKDWKILGRALGLTEVDMDTIKENIGNDVKEVVYQGMRKWIQKKGIDATPDNLIKALEDIERNDIVFKFCEKFKIQRNKNSGSAAPDDGKTQDVKITGKAQTQQSGRTGNQPHPNIHTVNPPPQPHPNILTVNPPPQHNPPQPPVGMVTRSIQQQQPNPQGGRFGPPMQQQPSRFGPPVQQQPSNQGSTAFTPMQHQQGVTGNQHMQHPRGHRTITNPPIQQQYPTHTIADTLHRPTQDETPHKKAPLIQMPDIGRLYNKTSESHFDKFFPEFLKNSSSRSLKDFRKGVDKVKNLKRDETKRIAHEMDWSDELKDKFDSDIKANLKVSNVLDKWAGVVYSEKDSLSTDEKKEKLQDFVRALRSVKGWDGREDVVEEICRHIKTGTVGTQAPPNTNYADLPYGVRFKVTMELNILNDNSGNGCSRIAELLGIENNLIRYLATRPEPGHQVLRSWETQADATVEKLYHVLLKCQISKAVEALE